MQIRTRYREAIFHEFRAQIKYDIRRNWRDFAQIRIFLHEKLVMLRMACTVGLSVGP